MRNETCYHEKTLEIIKKILESEIHSKNRIRLFYGDTETGQDWEEENDVIGYIGRSGGTCPIPILLKNTRSMGGSAILDHCIVKITNHKYVLYQHPLYHCKKYIVIPSDLSDYCEAAGTEEGLIARFKKPGQAQRYCDYMMGLRDNK